MDYFPILPPFEFKPFDDMSKKEAQNYFDWFMETKSVRLEQLKKLVDDTGYESCRLDYSDESLAYLWRWYLENVELVDRPEEEIREEVDRQTAGLTKIAISKGGVMTELNKEQMYEHFYNEKNRKKISTLWQFVAMDIGIYLGECLIKKHQDRGLHWGLVTKKTFDHFKPAVIGLKSRGEDLEERMETGVVADYQTDPVHIVRMLTLHIIKGKKDENALLESFRRIEEFVYLKHSPSNLVEIREMNEKDAHDYFEWYLYQIPYDMKLLGINLAGSYKSQYTDKSRLDYSEESLIYLWSWYLERLEFAEVTEQKKIERMKLKKRTKKPLAILEINGVEVYEGGIVLALDISVYFADLFRRKHEAQSIHWGYITEPKSLPYVNRPILRGFKPKSADGSEVVMDQIGIFYDLAVRAAAGERDKDALMHLYREWDAKV